MDLLADAVKGLPYDPENEYSVPYFWGTVGIVYDKNKVDLEDLEKEGFNIFLDEKYKGDVYLYDSERDSFMMALKALGYSMNTENEQELQEAYDWLVQCVETMDTEIVTDEIIDNMAQGRKALGLIYSGDASYVMAENPDMGYYMPESGTNLWSDAMVIPKNAKNPELAHAFINYASEYDGAYDNSSYVGYTSQTRRSWTHCPARAEIMRASMLTFRGLAMKMTRYSSIMKIPKRSSAICGAGKDRGQQRRIEEKGIFRWKRRRQNPLLRGRAAEGKQEWGKSLTSRLFLCYDLRRSRRQMSAA